VGDIQRIAINQERRACEAGESSIAKPYLDESSPEPVNLQINTSEVP
jgi:hypothetical protein